IAARRAAGAGDDQARAGARHAADLASAPRARRGAPADHRAIARPPGRGADAGRTLRATAPDARSALVLAALGENDATGDDLARRVLLLAALQVHFARLAALLPAQDLKPVADGACPACGSAPMTSSVVGWPGAHNTRFCACSLCGTLWNVVRIKCVLCSATGGISYHTIA